MIYFSYIMTLYSFISYVLVPIIFYYFIDKSLLSVGNGYVVGSIITIILWCVLHAKKFK